MATSPNIRKAAILLATLPREEAAALLAQFHPKQVAQLTREIAALDALTPHEQRVIAAEFCQATQAVPDASPNRAFRFLYLLEAGQIVELLADEHPQTIALVVAHLPRQLAVQVIAALRADRQAAVIRRIAALAPVEPDVVHGVAMTLQNRLASAAIHPAAAPRHAA